MTARRAWWISAFAVGTGKSLGAETSNERPSMLLSAKYWLILMVLDDIISVSSRSLDLVAPAIVVGVVWSKCMTASGGI
jgi:hypothetical protein